MISFAATPRNFKALIEFIITDLISPLVLLVASLAFLAFLWGIAVYIFKAGDEKSKEYGKNIMVYGVIALFVMVSVWSLVQILKNTFFESSNTPVNVDSGGGNPVPAGGTTGAGGVGGGYGDPNHTPGTDGPGGTSPRL